MAGNDVSVIERMHERPAFVFGNFNSFLVGFGEVGAYSSRTAETAAGGPRVVYRAELHEHRNYAFARV